MHGGYTSFFGIKFNKHNPNDYKILKLIKDNKVKEYSINEIEKLTTVENNCRLISFYTKPLSFFLI